MRVCQNWQLQRDQKKEIMALNPNQGTSDNLPDHEELMLDYATRLQRHVDGRRAVHVHLSELKSEHRRQHYMRIAASSFSDLVNDYEGQLFQLLNSDLIVVTKNATVAQIDQVILRLRYLFSEDPLTADEDEGSREFCSCYDLKTQYQMFLAKVRELHDVYESSRAVRAAQVDRPRTQIPRDTSPKKPLDGALLGQAINALATVDITAMLRRQTVCAIMPRENPTPVFHEVFVSIDDLRQRLMPDVNLTSNRWLFQHLTEVLDLRLLRALPDTERSVELPTSINVNISTLLSEDFQKFDRQFRIITRKAIILELQAIDIFADMGAYLFARDLAHERGYKICLDGLNHLNFPMIDRDALGLDFMKIYWTGDLVENLEGKRGDKLRQAISAAGPSRVILCRCDMVEALDLGHQLGIRLYQGRYVEGLVAASQR